MKPVIIIGTGLAGYNLAKEFRKLDTVTPLQLFTADDGSFYSKPMLSNALTNGKTPETLVMATAEQMAEQLQATVQTATTVTMIDPRAQHIIAGGKTISYNKLVLALGAKPVHLPLQGNGASAVMSINNLGDYAHFRKVISNTTRIAIIGPGLIGCEFANDLANAGQNIDVIGPDTAPLSRLLPPEAGVALQDALQGIGIQWHLGVVTEEIMHNDEGLRLHLADGTTVDTDAVLSAVGLHPNLDLATQAGLRTNRGIVVDRTLETSAKDVFALGDCMEVDGLVMPFVMPIMHCTRALAKTLAGQPVTLSYPAMPIVVKTPAHPVVVALPSSLTAGRWYINKTTDGVHAEFRDKEDHLLGFALTGTAIAQKQKLAKVLTPLMP